MSSVNGTVMWFSTAIRTPVFSQVGSRPGRNEPTKSEYCASQSKTTVSMPISAANSMRWRISSWVLPYIVSAVGVIPYLRRSRLISPTSSPGLTWWASGVRDDHRLTWVNPRLASSRSESSSEKS